MSTRFQRLPVIVLWNRYECATWDVRSGLVRTFPKSLFTQNLLTREGHVLVPVDNETVVYSTNEEKHVRILQGKDGSVALSDGKIATLPFRSC